MNNFEQFATIGSLINNRPDQFMDDDQYQILNQAYMKQFEKIVKKRYEKYIDLFVRYIFKGYPDVFTAAENDIILSNYKRIFRQTVQRGEMDYINIFFETKSSKVTLTSDLSLIAGIYTEKEYQFLDDAEKGMPLQKYIDDGIDINIINSHALIISCKNEFYDNAKLLLDNGANVHAYHIYSASGFCSDEMPLHECVENNNLDMIKLLINYGANIHANEESLLYISLGLRHHDITKYLIENGADINARNTDESWWKNRIILNALNNFHSNDDVWEKDLEMLKYLLNRDADITAKNNILLKEFVQYCHIELVKFLLEHGADVKSCNELVTKYYYPDADREGIDNNLNLKTKIELLVEYGATYNCPIKKKKILQA